MFCPVLLFTRPNIMFYLLFAFWVLWWCFLLGGSHSSGDQPYRTLQCGHLQPVLSWINAGQNCEHLWQLQHCNTTKYKVCMYRGQWALSVITSQHKNGTKNWGYIVQQPCCFAMIMFTYCNEGLGEAYIIAKIVVHSFVPILKCRSAFAWWDYSARDSFTLPICAN